MIDADFKVTVGNNEYLIKKRYFAFTGSALLETDDFDLPRDQWSECELISGDIKHGNRPIMIVGSMDRSSAIVEALSQRGHDPLVVFRDEAAFFSGKDLVLESLSEIRIPTISTGHFAPKKGRRKGQRKDDRRW